LNTSKCLEFQLPSGGGGLPAGMTRHRILTKIKEFSETYKVEYRYKSSGYRIRIWFPKEEYYTLFFLVSDVNKYWMPPTIEYEYYQDDNN